MQIPIVGPSYNLDVRKADVQRTINMFVSRMESGTGKSPATLESIYGTFNVSGDASLGPVRGIWATQNDRLFFVNGSVLSELLFTGGLYFSTEVGYLATSEGHVDINENLNQLILVDGVNGYVFDFTANVLTQIADPSFYGSSTVSVLNGLAIFVKPSSQQFYLSSVDDATVFDALDFASAESGPDNIVRSIVDHGQLLLFGTNGIEIWEDVGGSDFPLARNNGARIETGCSAAYSVCKLDNTVFWLGNDEHGGGIIWKLNGYTPVRVSTQAIEESIQSIADVSGAVAYSYQQNGHSFYCINIPGLATTYCYDVATNAWHERAELVDGEYAQHRGICHAYFRGLHYLGGSDGLVYIYKKGMHNNNGDVLVRDRISPHNATPGYNWQFFRSLQVDCEVGLGSTIGSGTIIGNATTLMMRMSNDGGYVFGPWHSVSLGAIGKRQVRAIFRRLGKARDRVWQIRFTDDASFSIVGANVT